MGGLVCAQGAPDLRVARARAVALPQPYQQGTHLARQHSVVKVWVSPGAFCSHQNMGLPRMGGVVLAWSCVLLCKCSMKRTLTSSRTKANMQPKKKSTSPHHPLLHHMPSRCLNHLKLGHVDAGCEAVCSSDIVYTEFCER